MFCLLDVKLILEERFYDLFLNNQLLAGRYLLTFIFCAIKSESVYLTNSNIAISKGYAEKCPFIICTQMFVYDSQEIEVIFKSENDKYVLSEFI